MWNGSDGCRIKLARACGPGLKTVSLSGNPSLCGTVL